MAFDVSFPCTCAAVRLHWEYISIHTSQSTTRDFVSCSRSGTRRPSAGILFRREAAQARLENSSLYIYGKTLHQYIDRTQKLILKIIKIIKPQFASDIQHSFGSKGFVSFMNFGTSLRVYNILYSAYLCIFTSRTFLITFF